MGILLIIFTIIVEMLIVIILINVLFADGMKMKIF